MVILLDSDQLCDYPITVIWCLGGHKQHAWSHLMVYELDYFFKVII